MENIDFSLYLPLFCPTVSSRKNRRRPGAFPVVIDISIYLSIRNFEIAVNSVDVPPRRAVILMAFPDELGLRISEKLETRG
jgi:hypothetical protein